jgi:hypothetical protein
MRWLSSRAELTECEQVPFAGDQLARPGPAIQDLVAGQIDLMIDLGACPSIRDRRF